jgi:hypothetical protein
MGACRLTPFRALSVLRRRNPQSPFYSALGNVCSMQRGRCPARRSGPSSGAPCRRVLCRPTADMWTTNRSWSISC